MGGENSRLVEIQCETTCRKMRYRNFPRSFSMLSIAAQDHEVISIPHRNQAFQLKQAIHRVQKEIGQQRRYRSALGNAAPPERKAPQP